VITLVCDAEMSSPVQGLTRAWHFGVANDAKVVVVKLSHHWCGQKLLVVV
jgi:hypothetical protein